MAEELLDKVRDVVEGEIDFEGQRRSEMVATIMLSVSGLLSLNIGYVRQDIILAMYIGLAGTALTFLVVVPPWPIWNRNPVKWLPVNSGTNTTTSTG